MNAVEDRDIEAPETSSFARLLGILRERWWIVALVTLVATSAAAIGSLRTPKQYDATAKLLFRSVDFGEATGGATVNPTSVDPARDAATNAAMVTTNEVARRVSRSLGPRTLSAGELLGKVTVTSENDADIVDVTVRDRSPVRAATVANLWATQFVSVRRAADQATVAASQDQLQRQLESLPIAATQQRDALQASIDDLAKTRAVQTGNAQVIDRAVPPGDPSVPKPKRDIILGFVLGLVLGLAAAFARDFFDRRVKSSDDFERLYGLRTLSVVPRESFDPTTQDDRGAALEPYRVVRNALDFASVNGEIRTIVVTSAARGEGKTTVAVNLARAVATSGQRVILLEGDLRRPSFGAHFRIRRGAPGLTTALVTRRPLEELLIRPVPGLRGLAVLPSGPLPPNSAELLRSASMTKLLEELAAHADLVIIDAPPLLPVADAQALLDHPLIDGCLLVARAWQTTRQEVRRTRAILEQHRLQPLGLVVTGLRGRKLYAYYGYRPDEADRAGVALNGDARTVDVPLSYTGRSPGEDG